MGASETRSDTLPDSFVVVGVELRVGSTSDWDNTLVSLFLSLTPSLPGGLGCPTFPANGRPFCPAGGD